MKKSISVFILTMLLFLLVGCSASDKDKTEYYKKNPQEAKKVAFQCLEEAKRVDKAIEKQADCHAVINATQELCREMQKTNPRFYLGDAFNQGRTIADFDCNSRPQMLALSVIIFAAY